MKKFFFFKNKKFLKQHGTILMLTLVMTSIFAVAALGISSLAISQHRLAQQKTAWHMALNIAEAGLNYYRWHLAHAPEDFVNDTGVHDFTDPQSGVTGQFNLEITPPSSCSSTITIKSSGWTSNFPNTKRVVQARFGLSSMASFAFITNSDVWFGDEESLHGPIHSNGGIRQDGQNDSLTTSAKETYTCQTYHGCNPAQTKPGIWGTGGDITLWQYPTSNIDFDMLTVNLSDLQTLADSNACGSEHSCYWPQKGLGYHFEFLSDGTFNVYRVTRLMNNVWYYDIEGKRQRGSFDFDRQELEGNYTPPSSCGIIFVEDDVWVDGIINGQVTLVSARLPETPNNSTKIVINGNITYLSKSGGHNLGLIAQKEIIVPLYAAPDNLEIDAVLLAQNGSVYRPYFDSPWPYYLRNTITTYGTIISNQVWTWSWINDGGTVISGYQNTNTVYDPHLNYNPPPGFPTFGEYKFLQWEEVTEK